MDTAAAPINDKLRWRENVPFWAVHVVALVGALWVGFSGEALAWLVATYLIRMFAITAGYHRYFSHRSYRTSRAMQFFLALLGATSVQKGPLWWAAHHRNHHKYSDTPLDVHSPRQRGFWWSHMFWILAHRYRETDLARVRDLAKFPELLWINRWETAIVVAFATSLWLVGGAVALVWGFFVSTVILWHATFTINSLAHVWGNRRYRTDDDSRNNPVLALLTLGEGWHNNHHHYQRSANQGFYWWEVDISYYVLRMLSWTGLVWDVHKVPAHIRDGGGQPEDEKSDEEPAALPLG